MLGAKEDGSKRIMDPTDPVRIEVEAALARAIPVIPILVDNARMPTVSDLPESLSNFAFRNAAQVEAWREFNQQIDRLIRSMSRLLESKPADAVEISARVLADKAPEPEPPPVVAAPVEPPSATERDEPEPRPQTFDGPIAKPPPPTDAKTPTAPEPAASPRNAPS
jgi:hypothetical protein